MNAPLPIDKYTGLVLDPKYKCIKGQGLCKLRTVEFGNFLCSSDKPFCYFRQLENLPIEEASNV